LDSTSQGGSDTERNSEFQYVKEKKGSSRGGDTRHWKKNHRGKIFCPRTHFFRQEKKQPRRGGEKALASKEKRSAKKSRRSPTTRTGLPPQITPRDEKGGEGVSLAYLAERFARPLQKRRNVAGKKKVSIAASKADSLRGCARSREEGF